VPAFVGVGDAFVAVLVTFFVEVREGVGVDEVDRVLPRHLTHLRSVRGSGSPIFQLWVVAVSDEGGPVLAHAGLLICGFEVTLGIFPWTLTPLPSTLLVQLDI
jgi:hypothetical protein